MRPRMTNSRANAPSTNVAARGDMSTRSQVPSTVPTAPKSVNTAIRRATAAKSPSRNSCRASMTMFGMIRTATALLTSITSASSGVARGGKPKLMAPLTRAARSTAAALKRAAGMRHPTLTPFFDVAHHPEGFDHDAGVRPRRRHSDAHAGSLGVGLRRRRGRRVSDVRLRPGGDGQAREGRYLAHARRLPVLHAPSLRPRRRLPLLPALSLGPEHRQGESAPRLWSDADRDDHRAPARRKPRFPVVNEGAVFSEQALSDRFGQRRAIDAELILLADA